MLKIQTIISDPISELVCKDNDGNYVQTDFDSEVETFVDSILADNYGVRSVTYMTADNRLLAIVGYSELTEQEKKFIAQQNSGLHLLNSKLES